MDDNRTAGAAPDLPRGEKPPGTTTGDVRTLKARFLIRETTGVVLTAAILFAAADTVSWTQGWVAVAIVAAWVAGTAYVLFTRQPGLIADRLRPAEGSKRWDIVILSIFAIGNIARLVVAGLDFRYGWTHVPPWLQVVGAVAAVAGYALGVAAIAANPFFAQSVRIQEERGHAVATGGPYAFVRHPGYSGLALYEIGLPLLLGSWWALVPGAIDALLAVVRTQLEDRMLHEELPGYADYARRVRHRLVPGVW